MTKIDHTRLSEIFRTLTTKTGETQKSPKQKKVEIDHSRNTIQPVNKRLKKDLRKQLKVRLKKLDESSLQFEKDAATATIHEVLLWEFGESVLSNPEFKRVSDSIVYTITTDEPLKHHMRKLVQSVINDE